MFMFYDLHSLKFIEAEIIFTCLFGLVNGGLSIISPLCTCLSIVILDGNAEQPWPFLHMFLHSKKCTQEGAWSTYVLIHGNTF